MSLIKLTFIQKIGTTVEDPQVARMKAVAYLQSTDWQVIAKYERDRPIPADVMYKRKAALDVVSVEPGLEA
ncbi:hypothetical protein ACQRBV_03110 [Pseudomonas sp. R11F]|uniref:hypothetical protein n=1 Tax=Pseudomonas TaxID=286 RepID=UPI00398EEBAF